MFEYVKLLGKDFISIIPNIIKYIGIFFGIVLFSFAIAAIIFGVGYATYNIFDIQSQDSDEKIDKIMSLGVISLFGILIIIWLIKLKTEIKKYFSKLKARAYNERISIKNSENKSITEKEKK